MLGTMEHDPHGGVPAHAGPDPGFMRFPCGHTEPDDSVGRRLRITLRAVWVACVRCNVVALVVEPAASDRRSRHGRHVS
jgi:hypothetical protein